jgi:cobalt/nickel transport system permease protein
MHISEGYLPAEVCIGGYAIASLTTWYSLRQINKSVDPSAGVPKAALLTAAFFIASSIKIPLPPSSVHLLLYGLLGITLGYYAFPAILVGLFLQAVIFQHGGLTTLGVNAAIAGIPTLLFYHLFQLRHAPILATTISPSLLSPVCLALWLVLAALPWQYRLCMWC